MPTKSKSKRKSAAATAASLAVAAPANPMPSVSAQPFHARSMAGLFGFTIFLSAFLMFQVELVLGKFVLPRFGGGPSVWSTALLTFQLLLLAGYGYAALVTARFSARVQSRIHLGLLLTSALALGAMILRWHSPVLPLSANPSADSSPVLQIAILLVTAAGFPCLLLSASSPLLQKWFSEQSAGASPYRLYAVSNLGSMLGLLSYPFVVERLLRLPLQARLWTAFYAVFLVATAICAWLQHGHAEATSIVLPPRKSRNKPAPQPRLAWLGLSMCGSAMLLATTNLICQEVAVIPLLWVLPLALYLLSFILCFDHSRWYRREIFHPLYLVLTLLSLRTLPLFSDMTIGLPLAIFCFTLFAVCMVCHGELARLKPEPRHLTGFYLMVSTGGALGSVFVVLVAPHLFNRFWEFQIALLGCSVLLATLMIRERTSWVRQFRFGTVVFVAGSLLFAVGAYVYTEELLNREGEGEMVAWRARNFFGMKTVVRLEQGSYLLHGRTLHGMQNANPAQRDEPTTYYRRHSGIGLLLENYPARILGAPLRMGVVGMGAGTLAAYGRADDFIRFYELDPDIAGLSQGTSPLFTFVKDSPAHVEVAVGDARIVLQQELARSEPQAFDILVVDAFSGDAVPVHLLTREALAIYLQHLRGRQSVLAFHVTNRSLDLRPVVAALAREYHLASLEIHPLDVGDWILLSADPSIFDIPALRAAGHPIELSRPPLLWTDDYSNLYSLLRAW